MSKKQTKAELKEALVRKWAVRPGQVWRLGVHLAAVGDAADGRLWDNLLAISGRRAVDNVLFSPVYADKRKGRYPGAVRAADYVAWFMGAIEPAIRPRLKRSGSMFINLRPHADGRRLTYDKRLAIALEDMARDPWVLYEDYIWIKTAYPGQARQRLKNAWEPIYQFARETPPAHTLDRLGEARPRQEDSRGFRASYATLAKSQGLDQWGDAGEVETAVVMPSNVIYAAPDRTGVPGADHPARFPRKVPAFFMRGWGRFVWADPFLGSGTSLIEAEAQGIQLLGIDLDPWAITQTLERWVVEYNVQPELYYVHKE